MYGPSHFFYEGLLILTTLIMATGKIPKSYADLRSMPQNAFESLKALRTIRQKTGPPHSLLNLMLHLKHQVATDPHDKIYGVLGLAMDKQKYPEPDYQQPVEHLYIQVAHGIVSDAGNPPPIGLFLAEAGIYLQDLSLPSWVPDWSFPRNFVSRHLQS